MNRFLTRFLLPATAVLAFGSAAQAAGVTFPVSGSNSVAVSSSALPTGAATSALQPALNADGGALVHITNPPASQAVTGAFYPATQPVSAATLPLPVGAATAANQPALNTDGGAPAHVTNFPTSQAVTGAFYPATQPVSATSLPLPSGAATAANQPTLNADGGAPAHVTNFPTTQIVSDTNSAAFQGEFAMTVGTSYTVGRSFKANCTVAGNVSMTYPDGSTGLWPLVVGIQTIPAAATMINSSGTTATATYTGLK